MWGLRGRVFKRIRRRFKMSGVSKDAPLGIQIIQKISSKCCPRLQINRLRCYQASVLALTYLTYMTYHLTRKPISVVKSVLHQNCSLLPPPPEPPTDDQWCNWPPFTSVLALTYLTYMTYHLTRKPISVVKSVLHQNCSLLPPPPEPPADDQWCNWPPFNTSDANTLLGALDSAFLFSYAAAMFVSGMVAERVDLRYFLSIGMLLSAIFCYLFGLARTYSIHHISYYILVQAGAGIAQTSGWPGTVATVGKWFGNAKKGLIFGIWNSHTSLGNILGTLMAAEYVDSDWSLSFVYPALVMGLAGGLVWLLLVPEPAVVGLSVGGRPPSRQSRSSDEEDTESEHDDTSQVIVGDQDAVLRPNRHSANAQRDSEPTEQSSLLGRRPTGAISLARAIRIPGVIEFSLSLFFAKLVSYTFLYWLPLYINTSTHLSARDSGKLSTVFDVGGAAGGVLAGLAADRSRSPALVCAALYAGAAPALLAYQRWGASSYWTGCALLALSGLLVNGPYALITTAVSAELGTHSSLAGSTAALATVTAIIDGTGSLGAALGPMLAGAVSSRGGWARVFYMLIACDAAALILLLRIAYSEVKKLRQERRIASPPRVRIE